MVGKGFCRCLWKSFSQGSPRCHLASFALLPGGPTLKWLTLHQAPKQRFSVFKQNNLLHSSCDTLGQQKNDRGRYAVQWLDRENNAELHSTNILVYINRHSSLRHFDAFHEVPNVKAVAQQTLSIGRSVPLHGHRCLQSSGLEGSKTTTWL